MLKILLMAALVSATSATVADSSRLITKIKQLGPKVQSTIAVGVTCLASICLLQFSPPASADVYELNSRIELLRRRNTFLHLGNHNASKGRRVAKWLGLRGDVEQENFLTLEAGLDMQTGIGRWPFNFFLNGQLKRQIDADNFEPEVRAGMDFILKYIHDTWSEDYGIGYINAEGLLTKDNLQPLALRFYLVYHQGPGGLGRCCVLGVPLDDAAVIGYEYFSGENEDLLGTEELNGHLFSLVKISKSGERFLPGEVGIIRGGYNITYGVGVFYYKKWPPYVFPDNDEVYYSHDYPYRGNFFHDDSYQERVLHAINKKTIDGTFVRVGGHLDYILYAGRLNVSFAGENKTVFSEEVSFLENSFNMTTEIIVLPQYDVRLEANLHIIHQILLTESETEQLHDKDRGGSVMFMLKKGF